jgi:glutathione S-transferase
MTYPILYTFRRCPYAIRARMALRYANITVRIREIVLRNKPESMLAYSPKGTVPVLILSDGLVIDQSQDIMRWALKNSDPDAWLREEDQGQIHQLIEDNDNKFKPLLDNYKYPQNSEKQDSAYYRNQAIPYLQTLNDSLGQHRWLLGEHISLADVALFPFIRQFAMVDKDWFWQSSLLSLQTWLQYLLDSDLFLSVMKKYQPWEGEEELLL